MSDAMNRLMADMIAAGQTVAVAGRRGAGKTFLTTSIMQRAVEGEYELSRPVVAITNIVFAKKEDGVLVEEYPPGVRHADTMAETLRTACGILEEYGPGNVTIMWVLDEAQNYMLADQNAAAENLALVKFLGNARKFDMCNWFLTPAFNNLVPRIRCFPEDENKSGYCSYRIFKDRQAASDIAAGTNLDPRAITFYTNRPDMVPQPIIIKGTSWTKGIDRIRSGEYSYDTKATAMFTVGENANGAQFDLASFIKATSSGLSTQVPRKAAEWFAAWDAKGGEKEEASAEEDGENSAYLALREQCLRVSRMRQLGIKWADCAVIEDTTVNALRGRMSSFNNRIRRLDGCSCYSPEDAPAQYIQPIREGLEGGNPAPAQQEV